MGVACSLFSLGAVAETRAPQHGEILVDSSEIRNTTLTVERSETATCPGARELHARVLPLLGAAASGPEEPPKPSRRVLIHIRRTGDELTASIEVDGRENELRILRSPDLSCDELARNVTTSLVLLLDPERESSADDAASGPTVAQDTAEPAPEPAPVAAPASRAEPRAPRAALNQSATFSAPSPAKPSSAGAELSASGGTALTLGLAEEAIAVAVLGARLRGADLSAMLDLFYGTSGLRYADGDVDVTWFAAQARGCARVLRFSPNSRGELCALFAAGVLRGEASNYPVVYEAGVRPWFAAGGGAVVSGAFTKSLGWELNALGFAPLREESFSVANRGAAFRTPNIGAWFGVSITAQLL